MRTFQSYCKINSINNGGLFTLKKIIVPVLLAAAFSFSLTSCGSTPKTENTTPSTIQDKVNDVENKIEEATTVDNSSALEKTEAARNAAIEAGADKVAETQFSAADKLFEELKTQSESGLDISLALSDVESRYNALSAYTKALENKKKINDKNLSSYDTTSYQEGCTALSDFENLNSSTNLLGKLMLDKAEMANGKFLNVLNKAYKQLAKDARLDAFKTKRDADSVKAGVAAKEDYKKAAEEFKLGDQNYAMQNAESAYNHYLSSSEQFAVIFKNVSEKREAAQKAIDEAKAKVEAAANYALQADQEKPLEGENIEGIESEDTVLLEADNYDAPESQEAEIPEQIDDYEVENFEGTDSSLKTVVQDAVESVNEAATSINEAIDSTSEAK